MADPPLDEVGEMQATTLTAAMVPLRPLWVVSSDLQRARRTASIVASACGVEVVTDPAFREVDVGTWEGLTPSEVAARLPDEHRRWLAGEDVRRGGGETLAEAVDRFVAALVRVGATLPPPATGVVIAHGIVLQGALEVMARSGMLLDPDLTGGAPHLDNGAWLALEVRTPVG